MKNILLIIIGFSFAIAQENYKEFKLESPVKTQTNNSYRLYFNALDGVYINGLVVGITKLEFSLYLCQN